MSDAPKEEGKKKKGKLPVLIVVVAVLFGGGFFGMKMKGGDKKEPEIKLGKIVEFDEKLFNLSDMQTYLRTTVALHLKDGYDEAKFKEVLPAVEDTMNLVIRAKSPAQVQTVSGIQKLKKELAERINAVLANLESGSAGHKEDKKDGAKGKGDDSAESKKEVPDNDWDSQSGPVLKVYFKAFAVQ